MNRRDFFKLLTATPAAFLVGKYGMPGGGDMPMLQFIDYGDRIRLTPEAILTYKNIQTQDGQGGTINRIELLTIHGEPASLDEVRTWSLGARHDRFAKTEDV